MTFASLQRGCRSLHHGKAQVEPPQYWGLALACLASCGGSQVGNRQVKEPPPAVVQRDSDPLDKEEVPPTGRLPPPVIRKVVQAAYPEFQRCYREGLRADRHLQGKLTVRFVIDVEGNVSHAHFGESTLLHNEVGRCVLDIFNSLKFPKPQGVIVTVRYPILFSPATDEEAAACDEEPSVPGEECSTSNDKPESTSPEEHESGASADPASAPGAD